MASRFGRNQKRKLRQQLTDAELKFQQQQQLNSSIQGELDLCIEELNYTKSVLGEFHIAFKAQEINATNANKQGFISVPIIYEANSELSFGDLLEREFYQYGDLYLLLSETVVKTENLRSYIHTKVRFGDGVSWAYAVDARSARFIPKEHLSRQIAEALAEKITQDLSSI
jgi:hypothetical protein